MSDAAPLDDDAALDGIEEGKRLMRVYRSPSGWRSGCSG
jgi:hypothetical protein